MGEWKQPHPPIVFYSLRKLANFGLRAGAQLVNVLPQQHVPLAVHALAFEPLHFIANAA